MHADHINGIRHDNRRCNLRWVDPAQNMQNKAVYKNSTTGVRGVTALPNGKYLARVQMAGQRRSVGCFNTLEDAAAAAKAARLRLMPFTNEARGG